MSEKLDLIVLGATGFTGKQTVKNLAFIVNSEKNFGSLSWGIAGRSRDKLHKIDLELQEAGVSDLTILLCDVQNEKSLIDVTAKAKVIVNCTGPNTLLSGNIIKACIANGTHYVDISAELYHILDVYRLYNQQAEQENVLIVPACGFASIPVVAGLIHLEKHFKGTLSAVECYTSFDFPKRAYFPGPNKCLVHYGTWESLVHELTNLKKFHELKTQVFPGWEPVPEDLKRSFFHRSRGKLWYPYPGPDESIVAIDQAYRQQKEIPTYFFKSYATMPLLIHFIIVPVFFMYYYLCYFRCFRKLLWKYPRAFTLGYFSHKGPSEKMRNDTKYSFTLYGKGTNAENTNTSLAVKVSGSDPGYKTTAIAVICAAITVLLDRPNMPKGGVLSVGTAFKDAEIVNRLLECGMDIEILDE